MAKKKKKRTSGEAMVVLNPMADLLQEELQRGEEGENDIAHLVGPGGEGVQPVRYNEQQLREAFNVVDHDNDGELMHSELDAVLHVLGAKPTVEEVKKLMIHLDADKDGDVEMDDWIASVQAGKLQLEDHGAVMDLERIREIRSAFLRIDNNSSGMLTHEEFVSAIALVVPEGEARCHMDERTAEKIWDQWATPAGDFCCEMECWVSHFKDWSTEASDMDPLRKKFIAAFSAGVATQLKIDSRRVKLTKVVPGFASRADGLAIVADKVNKQVTDNLDASAGDKATASAEAESLGDYERDICTVTFKVESLNVARLMAAIRSGSVEAATEELAIGVPPNMPELETGATPLHVAARHGHAELCQVLLEGGADPAIMDRRMHTPLAAAQNEKAKGDSGYEAVIEVLEEYQRGRGSGGSSKVMRFAQLGSSKEVRDGELLKKIKRFRKTVRKDLKQTATSTSTLMHAKLGECPVDELHALKFVDVQPERVITWPDFVKGYARFRHTPLGAKVSLAEISLLSSSVMHKLIGTQEHVRALHHPEVSILERIGIKMLAAHAAEPIYKDPVTDEEAEQANTKFAEGAEDQFQRGNLVHQKLQQFGENEKNWATSTRRMILRGVIFCALSGGLAAFVSGVGDLVAIQLYQPDAAIVCPEPTGSSSGTDDCIEHQVIFEAVVVVLLPFLIVCTAIELGGLYYNNMQNCMKIASSVGLVLWPLDEGRVKIARRLVQAAFEIAPSTARVYGIDPLKLAPNWKVALQLVVHKVKMGASKKIVKLLVKRMVTRAGAREATYLATVSAFSMIPVGLLWNGFIAYQTNTEARLRALGTMVVLKYVDELLPLHGIHGRAGKLSNDVCTTIVRAIGCVAVAKREVHVNSDTLLRRVHERLLHLDLDLEQDDTLFEDSDGYGWGEIGFRDEDLIDDEDKFHQELTKINNHDEAHAELIFEIMLLACVIDGGVSDHELQLLSRTRLTIEPSDAWPATMSGDDKTLHEDVLDSLIEERCRTWAGVIRNGGHTFGTEGNDGLHNLMSEIHAYHDWVKAGRPEVDSGRSGEEFSPDQLHSAEWKEQIRRKKLNRCCRKFTRCLCGSLCH